MDALCRLCGSSDGIRIRIFDPETDYVKRIHKVLPISINEHDPFPKTMCHKCSFKVNEFFEFRIKCIKAQETFRRKIPWLKNSETSIDTTYPPMVEVHLSQVNSISPNEKAPLTSRRLIDENDPMIVIDDSPPYKEDSLALSSENGHPNQKNNLDRPKQNVAKKKTTPRTIWDSKKRKRQSRKNPEPSFKIAEVFTTSIEEYQVIESVEQDPLDISQKDEIKNENNNKQCRAENSSTVVRTGGEVSTEHHQNNSALPKSILITNIPEVGLVYTCELCGRTFLSPAAGAAHAGQCKDSSEDEKTEIQELGVLPSHSSPPDYYTCNICGKIFSRQSQLKFHLKTHLECGSSATESGTSNNKKRNYKKRIKIHNKQVLKNNEDSFLTSSYRPEHSINRHSLLSSESD